MSWIFYLRRIAQIYARGRYSVRPIKAVAAPAEIRELAEAMGGMAATLAARDVAIKENLAAKDNLMREIHHRVKNNLQVISSLLSLQQRSLDDEAARAAIRDTRQRILALSVIYRALYEGPDLKHVDLKDFVNELVAQLMVENRDLPTRTDLQAAPLIIDPDRLAPLALFIVEAVANVGRKNCRGADGQLQIRFAPPRKRGRTLHPRRRAPSGCERPWTHSDESVCPTVGRRDQLPEQCRRRSGCASGVPSSRGLKSPRRAPRGGNLIGGFPL